MFRQIQWKHGNHEQGYLTKAGHLGEDYVEEKYQETPDSNFTGRAGVRHQLDNVFDPTDEFSSEDRQQNVVYCTVVATYRAT